MSGWQTLSSEVLHQTPWLNLRKKEMLNHVGKPMTMTYLELHSPTVSVIATNEDHKILLIKSYRPIIDQTVWEIPAGHSDGQDLLVAAKRELQEETGLGSQHWTDLGTFFIAPGVADIQQKYFLAEKVFAVEGDLDADEQIIERRFFSIEEIENMLLRGEITSYMAPIGVYLAKIRQAKKKEH